MKLRGTIVEETTPQSNSMIIRFDDDTERRHFEVKCSFNPHEHRFRKWDTVDMIIKLDSEVFEDPKTNDKSYFTHLTCDKAVEFNSPYIK